MIFKSLNIVFTSIVVLTLASCANMRKKGGMGGGGSDSDTVGDRPAGILVNAPGQRLIAEALAIR